MGTNTMMPNDVAFTCICKEPEGEVLRSVRFIEFTPDNLNKLWAQVSKFPTLMGQEVHSSLDMLRFFLHEESDGSLKPKGLCLVVDEFIGIFWLTDIKGINIEASVHYTFFDRRHWGREELCKQALRYAFDSFKFRRIWTQVPVCAKGVMKFVELLGFTKVGRLRKNTFFKGKFYDTNVYDMLQEELDGIRNDGQL